MTTKVITNHAVIIKIGKKDDKYSRASVKNFPGEANGKKAEN